MIRRLLGLVLLVMAVAQAADLDGFQAVLAGYGLDRDLARWGAVVLVVVELLAGVALVAGRRREHRAGATLAVAVGGVWTALTLTALVGDGGPRESGLLGTWGDRPPTWASFVGAVVILLLATRSLGRRTFLPRRSRWSRVRSALR
jgi:hypothetical protein